MSLVGWVSGVACADAFWCQIHLLLKLSRDFGNIFAIFCVKPFKSILTYSNFPFVFQSMLKKHSFANPFPAGRKKMLGTNGRSNSAPEAFDFYVERYP